MAEKMTELENEVKEFHRQSNELIGICSSVVRKVEKVTDFDSFLNEYPTAYRYLSNCAAAFFEFNCRMETLRIGNDFTRDDSIGVEEKISRKENPALTEEDSSGIENSPDTDKLPEVEKPPVVRLEASPPSIAPDINLRKMKIDRKLGSVYTVVLSRLVSPDEFYVHVKCEELSGLKELNQKLSEIEFTVSETGYNSPSLGNEERKALASRVLGSYALGYSIRDSAWKRIKVLDWRIQEKDDLIRVLQVDSGWEKLLPLSQTLPMSESVAKYPIFAEKCYLSSIAPYGGGDWCEEDRTMFEIFTESTEKMSELEIEIEQVVEDGEDEAIGVNLLIPEGRVSINGKLVEFGIAKIVIAPSRGRYLSAWKVGDRIPVKVTCISRVNHIFCVKDYGRMGEEDALELLINSLNELGSETERLDCPPEVEDLVIAKYEDGLWYRAKVVKWNRDLDSWRVRFLDYGNTENVSLNDMRKIDGKHLTVPFQMIECFLDGVKLKLKGNQREGAAYLNERVAEEVTIEIRNLLNNGGRNVYSVSIFDGNGKDIAGDLVSAGHVVWSEKC